MHDAAKDKRARRKTSHQNKVTSTELQGADCANRGLVSTQVQEDVPQPTLHALLHSLQD